ncbi:NAD-dependent histone deacetylase sir2 [Mortierella sp. NVP85]|nr:NAD-dependent histone deacetylase sir2 [Mortierella sp. NVP85]
MSQPGQGHTQHPVPRGAPPEGSLGISSTTALKVPPASLTTRPESPVNRKRADDDLVAQGHHGEGGSPSNNSLPPTKKSKTSPPLVPRKNVYAKSGGHSGHSLSDYRISKETANEALSPQTSPMTEPLLPVSASLRENRYSSAADHSIQPSVNNLNDHEPLSPSFRPTSPPFRASSPPNRVSSPPFRAMSPSFGRSATAILESLSKPGENSLGNLNLGAPVIGRTPVGERIMGVITSQPSSRQGSPDLRSTSGATGVSVEIADVDLNEAEFSLDDITDTVATGREPSPAGPMRISDDDAHHDENIDRDDDSAQQSLEEEPMHPTDGSLGFISESDEFGDDSLDDIDVEGIGMLNSDSDSEEAPYQDPDPMCLDRPTEEEADIIMDEARVHGVGFIIRRYVLTGEYTTKKLLLMTIPEQMQIEIPDNVTESDLIRTISERFRKILRKRTRLQNIHSLEHMVDLLKTSERIMVLTGAGVSVSCGIPDFRSKDGIYSRLSEFELDDPQQMFDLEFFRERPQIFYSFAREIFPSNFVPSPSHYFIKLLEDQGRLLRNYTQNIDTLEQKAGIQKVLQCHGSFATASCVRCGHQVPGDDIKEEIFKQEVAYCTACKTPSPPPKAKKRSKSRYHSSDEDESDDDDDRDKALMKPDIVFFGEKLPAVFHQSLKEDREKVDLLIVIGSSLKVAPVSDIMHQLPPSVPQILINRTPNYQMEFDLQLLGNCDTIVAELCRMAGWELKHEKLPGGTSNVPDMDKYTNKDGSGAGGRAAWSFMEPNIYLFEGAEREEVNFKALQERNRKRARGEPGGGDTSMKRLGEASGDEGSEVEDMDGMTNETSKRRLLTRDYRGGSLGLMDEDEPEVNDGEEESDDGSEKSQCTARGSNANQALISPFPQPSGSASGTTEPRSASIVDVHQTGLDVTQQEAPGSALSSTSTPSGLQSSTLIGTGNSSNQAEPLTTVAQECEDDDEEEARIRVMFTEKMPKDLGEEQCDEDGPFGHGHSLGHSQHPSENLRPIAEDCQGEVEGEDDRDRDDSMTGTLLGTSTLPKDELAMQPTDARIEEP